MAKLTFVFILLVIGVAVWCKSDISDDNESIDEDIEEGGSEFSRSGGPPNSFPRGRLKPSLLPGNTRLTECYVCTDCPEVFLNTTTKFCPTGADNSKRGCVTYTEKYAHMKKPWHIRGCASERGNCEDLKNSHASHKDVVQLISCGYCEGDRCNTNNGVEQSLPSFAIEVLTLIITPLLGKYTLS